MSTSASFSIAPKISTYASLVALGAVLPFVAGAQQKAQSAQQQTQQETQQDKLVELIRGAGRIPVERDTVYNELRRWEPQSPAGAR